MTYERFKPWGENVRKYRRGLKPPVSQADLAERVGVNQTTVSDWECGESLIPDTKKLEIASALGIRPNRLFSWRDIEGSGFDGHGLKPFKP